MSKWPGAWDLGEEEDHSGAKVSNLEPQGNTNKVTRDRDLREKIIKSFSARFL